MNRPFFVALVMVAVLALAACGQSPEDVLPQPRDGRSGIQLAGQLGGRQLAVNDGLPELNSTDCDVAEGPDQDLCLVTEDINGELLIVVFENPAVLQTDAVLEIGSECTSAAACDEVDDVAVVEIQVGSTGRRMRAESGELRVEAAEEGQRYRGAFDLTLPDGSDLSATFDLVPRPEELN